jgi:3-deoxy-D-manno-octulosonic-acid transferase
MTGVQRSRARSVAWLVYDVLAEFVVWVLLVPFAGIQLIRGHATTRDIGERLGTPAVPPRRAPRRVVVHAVSVGEVAAAGAFIVAVHDMRPDWSIVLTCGNRASRSLAADLRRRIPTIEAVLFLPWDRRPAVDRFLHRVEADAVVIVEPEIWPNLYRACERAGVPLMLVNAHIYPRDVARYRMVRWFLSDVLRVPTSIAAQSERDRAALISIGAPPETLVVSGNFKFDVAGHAAAAAESTLPRSAPIVVGGSTHEPEETLLLDACERLRRSFDGLRLIVAPRDLRRVSRVAAMACARGLRTVLASDVGPADDWDVLLVDRFGLLPAMYALADVAFVGGSLARRGGHNVLEPAAHGRPVIVGPHVDHVRDIVDGLEAAGGLIRLDDTTSAALERAIRSLLDDDDVRRAMGERARAYQRGHAGAADRCARALVDSLELTHHRASSSRMDAHAASARRELADRLEAGATTVERRRAQDEGVC